MKLCYSLIWIISFRGSMWSILVVSNIASWSFCKAKYYILPEMDYSNIISLLVYLVGTKKYSLIVIILSLVWEKFAWCHYLWNLKQSIVRFVALRPNGLEVLFMNLILEVQVDSYVYLPPNFEHSLTCDASATLVVFERRYILYGHRPEYTYSYTSCGFYYVNLVSSVYTFLISFLAIFLDPLHYLKFLQIVYRIEILLGQWLWVKGLYLL